jgi:arylsulfatase A-like enzyme
LKWGIPPIRICILRMLQINLIMNVKNIVLVAIALLIFGSCSAENKTERPNILIIQPDQHRADAMGCAGNTMAITPNLDKLALSGIRFTHAASASPVCSPFRATLQTGLYIHEHGVVENGIQLKHDLKTIGEHFSENGYSTGYIGKWHLEGFLPEESVGGFIEPGESRQGWQEWLGYEKSHEFLEVWKYNDQKEKVRLHDYNWEPTWHTDIALDFIKRKTEENQPWCYYLAYGPPHKPEQCLPEFLNMYDPLAFELPPGAERDLTEDSKQELRTILQMYYAQVSAVDYEVGRLVEGLKELGVDKNTIIVYVSDHGDVLGSHNGDIVQKYIDTQRDVNNTLRTKGKPFSTAFRIPFIISGPDVKNAGLVCDALVSSVDLAPTILDMAGIEIPEYMQGQSMAAWYRNGEGPEQPYIYLGLHNDKKAWRAVWDGQYMLSMLDYQLFYDHSKDPYELENLYNNPTYFDKRKEFESLLIELAKETGDPILPRLEKSVTY